MSVSAQPLPSQPKGIFYIFQAELWERFSYYGITALLILYMSKFFTLPEGQIYALYGTYGALVYTTPILGGILADQYLGQYRTVMLGGVLISLGHFIMIAVDPKHFYFFLGLSFIIVGTGFFKPNISTLLGQLYKSNDPRRENGFIWAYLFCNIGTIIAPILTSLVAIYYSWHFAFGLAGLGMVLGLIILHLGKKYLNSTAWSSQQKTSLQNYFLIFAGILILLFVVNAAFFYTYIASWLLISISIFAFSLLAYTFYKSYEHERASIIFVAILILFYIVFMTLLQQSGGMLNLFTERNVNRTLGTWEVPTGMFQSIEPLSIVLFGPFYTWYRSYLNKNGMDVDYVLKFLISLIGMTTAFLLLTISIRLFSVNGYISMWWINLSYMIQAASELFIGPIGLAMISNLIPKRFIGIFMGIWVLASAFANFIAAKIGASTTLQSSSELLKNPVHSIQLYGSIIENLTFFILVVSFVLLLLRPFLLNFLTKSKVLKVGDTWEGVTADAMKRVER